MKVARVSIAPGYRLTIRITLLTVSLVSTLALVFSLLVCAFRISCDPEAPHADYMKYIDGLPMNPDPEAFGMHANANISFQLQETRRLTDAVLSIQPRLSSAARSPTRSSL